MLYQEYFSFFLLFKKKKKDKWINVNVSSSLKHINRNKVGSRIKAIGKIKYMITQCMSISECGEVDLEQ